MLKKHKTYSSPIGDTGEHEVWTLCGLGEYLMREVEFDIADKRNIQQINCKACIKALQKMTHNDGGKQRREEL